MTTCFRCGCVMDAAEVTGAVHPPRAPRWKKPIRQMTRRLRRRFALAQLRQTAKAESARQKMMDDYGIWQHAAADRPPGRLRRVLPILFPALVSLLPGLGHALQRRFRETLWRCVIWVISLLLGIFLYGGFFGWALIGMAVVLHGSIIIDACIRNRTYELVPPLRETGNRLAATLAAACIVALLYGGVRWTVFSDYLVANAAMAIPAQGIQLGDMLLCRTVQGDSVEFERGDLVLIPQRSLGALFALRSEAVGQIVALPGESVAGAEGKFLVASEQLDERSYPMPSWLRGTFQQRRLGREEFFVAVEYNVQGDRQAAEQAAAYAHVIARPAIRARAIMRWLPLARRGRLDRQTE